MVLSLEKKKKRKKEKESKLCTLWCLEGQFCNHAEPNWWTCCAWAKSSKISQDVSRYATIHSSVWYCSVCVSTVELWQNNMWFHSSQFPHKNHPSAHGIIHGGTPVWLDWIRWTVTSVLNNKENNLMETDLKHGALSLWGRKEAARDAVISASSITLVYEWEETGESSLR